jgi:DNA polymerase III delta prime subunit
MRTTVRVVIIIIPIVILASLLFVYLISLSYVSTGEIDKQVENLQTKYRQDFSEEIREYPAYRVISEVLGEPSVKEMYRDYLEALNYGSGKEANNMYEIQKLYRNESRN